ncbi:MAG: M42 family metallopeptidase [Methanomicrobiales archaeon]|nr:M42 family metallopeptidase [Methanomicrobiales archaeon]
MVYELLKKLSDAHGLSGFEGNIKEIVRKELDGYVDEVFEDKLGNLIAVKRGTGTSVMIASHMDEIGLMVQYIDEKGFIKFVGIGGWYNPTLHTQRVVLHGKNGPVHGVIGAKPPHVMTPEDRKKEIKIEDLYIDIGATSAEDVEKAGIEIGTPVTIEQDLIKLTNDRVTGKALDNRVGVLVLIETLRRMNTPMTIYGVFTVQEEIGLKGAKVSAFALNPDIAIATDVTIPGDHPGVTKKEASVEMGKGPVLVLASASGRGLLADARLISWIRNAGDKKNIPYQLEVGDGGNTDASIINLVRDGIPSIPLSVPSRYIHSPVEVVDMKDVQATIDILVEVLKKKPKM